MLFLLLQKFTIANLNIFDRVRAPTLKLVNPPVDEMFTFIAPQSPQYLLPWHNQIWQSGCSESIGEDMYVAEKLNLFENRCSFSSCKMI